MSESKKRAASSDGAAQVKKPKFEKKSIPKKNAEHQNKKKANPFEKTGKSVGANQGRKPTGKFANGKVGKFQKPANAAGKFIKSEGAPEKQSAPPPTTEKVDWKKFKQEKKDLKLKRKATKVGFDQISEAKQIYERLKCKSTENKADLCRELHKVFRNPETYQRMVMAHDTTRIIQCMLKHAESDICQQISEALVPVVGKLAICDYAHFVVPRLLKYGSQEIKRKVIDAAYGNVFSMLSRSKSTAILDSIYISYANSQQKALLRQELYGELYKKSKDKNVKCINDTYKDSPHMKLAVLNSVKSNLNHIANKSLVDNSLVHAVLLDYLNECSEEDRTEIIATYLPHIAALASTKDGVRAAMLCFWHSIVKDRRAILKTIREHLIKLCTHEHGHILILNIINSTDDTKALKKSIFDPIYAEIETIAANEWGQKVIDWFVAPATTTSFHPQMIASIEEGLKFSKKDKDVRRAELLEQVNEPLCRKIAENPYFWMKGGHIAFTTFNILSKCTGDVVQTALDAIAGVVCDINWMVAPKETEDVKQKSTIDIKKMLEGRSGDEETNDDKKNVAVEMVFGVEHAGLHMALKKFFTIPQFAASLIAKLNDNVIEAWLPLNRPTFLLIKAYETDNADVQQQIKTLVTKHKKLLKSQTHAASKILKGLLGVK